MKAVLICLTILLLLRLMVALYNFFLRPVFPQTGRIKDDPLISILIRADNSSTRLGHILELLHKLSYPRFEVIVGIYRPTQPTLDIIRSLQESDSRFNVLNIRSLHKDWLSTPDINYQLGQSAKGNYLVFMDADVELRPGVLQSLISYMRNHKLGMISILPHFRLHNFAERVSWPWVNLLFLTLAPIWKSRRVIFSQTGLAGRNFMIFDGDVYRQFQPFDEVKKRTDWGRGIAQYLFREGISFMPLVGDKRIILQGCLNWKRCIIRLSYYIMIFFRRSFTFAFFYTLIYCFWFIPFLIAGKYFWMIGCMLINILMRIIVSSLTKTSVKENIIYGALQNFSLPVILWVSIMHHVHKCRWKHCKQEKCKLLD